MHEGPGEMYNLNSGPGTKKTSAYSGAQRSCRDGQVNHQTLLNFQPDPTHNRLVVQHSHLLHSSSMSSDVSPDDLKSIIEAGNDE